MSDLPPKLDRGARGGGRANYSTAVFEKKPAGKGDMPKAFCFLAASGKWSAGEKPGLYTSLAT